MIKKITYTALLIVIFLNYTYAADIKISSTPKILFYNLKSENSTKKFKYYSFIIPHTISKKIKRTKKYNVLRLPVEVKNKYNISSSEMNKDSAIYKSLKKHAQKYQADYIIFGSTKMKLKRKEDFEEVDFSNKKAKNKAKYIGVRLNIKLIIFSNYSGEFALIEKRSTEVGAYLKSTINDLSFKIDEKITEFQERNRLLALKKIKEKIPKSPYLGIYRRMNFVTFGIETGIINIIGDWSKIYNDSKYISPYLFFNTSKILPNTGISLNVDYFAINNEDKSNDSYDNSTGSSRSTYQLWGTTIDFHYFLNISELFYVSFSLGMGAMFSDMKVSQYSDSGSTSDILGENSSTDFYLDLSLSFNVQIDPVQVRFGASYKGIFQKSPMNTYTIFIGFGYSI